MLSKRCQRWELGVASGRPAGELINTRIHEVAAIQSDTIARDFVNLHHYSRSFPAARERFGLYRGAKLVGVAVFSVPMQGKVLDVLPCDRAESVELGRFVLLDEVPGNGESWFVARAFELLYRQGYRGVIAFADPVPRTDAQGRRVKPGHVGVIYQASNARLAGRSTARTLHVLPDGTVFSPRTMQKIRTRERNWQSATEELVRFGASPLGAGEDGATWLARWLPRLGRKMRHPGNYRYLFGLDRRVRRLLPPSDRYPKLDDEEIAA